eukprot:760071-Hanusia_phi.AAC.1
MQETCQTKMNQLPAHQRTARQDASKPPPGNLHSMEKVRTSAAQIDSDARGQRKSGDAAAVVWQQASDLLRRFLAWHASAVSFPCCRSSKQQAPAVPRPQPAGRQPAQGYALSFPAGLSSELTAGAEQESAVAKPVDAKEAACSSEICDAKFVSSSRCLSFAEIFRGLQPDVGVENKPRPSQVRSGLGLGLGLERLQQIEKQKLQRHERQAGSTHHQC